MISILKSRVFSRKKRSQPAEPVASGISIDQLRRQFPDAAAHHLQTIYDCQSFTMTSPERVLALCESVDHIVKNKISGDIVECGVWKGGSSAAAARTLLHHNSSERMLWLYDTFSGMCEPTKDDQDFLGRDAGALLSDADESIVASILCLSPLDEVKSTMVQTEYPLSRVRYVEGKVEETLMRTAPESIALLRLDTDWYESTRCELEVLFPKLVPGGILIIDDYGHWNGCRKAVDEYFAENNISIFLNRIDYTGRLGVK